MVLLTDLKLYVETKRDVKKIQGGTLLRLSSGVGGRRAAPCRRHLLAPGRVRVAAARRTGVAEGDAGGGVEHALGAAVLDRRLDRAGGHAALQLHDQRRSRGRRRARERK